ncbi:DUF6504 family protein [Chloroflexota bacterium]
MFLEELLKTMLFRQKPISVCRRHHNKYQIRDLIDTTNTSKRNYYQVKAPQGEIFEIYYDRGTGLAHPERKKWFLYRQL